MLFDPSTKNRTPTLTEAAALGFTSSLGPLSANTYVPGFHRMAEDLSTSFIHIEQSLTVYLITFALCSIFAGTLSDTLGRKKTLVGGMLLFTLASIGAMLAANFWTLCFWRVLQGMGAAVGQVVTQAIVRDRWGGVYAARMNGMIAMFFAVSPAIAPVITIMKFDVDQFAWYTIPTVITTLLGSWGSAYVLKRMGARPMVYSLSFGAVVICGLIALDEYFVESGYPWALLCPCFFWFVCSLLRPVMMAMNLDYFPKNRGLAASIQQCFVTASFSICAALWVPLVMGAAWKYALVTSFCAFMVFVFWTISMRLRPQALEKAGVAESFK